MSRVIPEIKNNEKGKHLLDFLKQIDFLEIKEAADEQEGDKKEIE